MYFTSTYAEHKRSLIFHVAANVAMALDRTADRYFITTVEGGVPVIKFVTHQN